MKTGMVLTCVATCALMIQGCSHVPVMEIEGGLYTQLNPHYKEDKNILATAKVRAYLCKPKEQYKSLREFSEYFHMSNPATSREKVFVGDLIGAGVQLKLNDC